MKNIFACLTGTWTCLNEDTKCVMGENRVSPRQWYEENAEIFSH